MEEYILKIFPAIRPAERHRLQEELEKMGYYINGGGTVIDMSECDISFRK